MSLAVKTHLIIEDRGHITIVRFIDGKILEDFEVETIGNQLYQLIENHGRRKIILDFSLVRYMSSAMLGKLAVLQRKMNSVHGNLRLCNVHPEIYPVFRITKMHTILSLHDHLDQALEGI